MANPTYNSDNYSDQGGNEWVVGPGGTISVQQGGYIIESVQDGITAHAGGGQANATPLPAVINRVTTVASAADSVALPASRAGVTISVINATANAMQVFGLSPDTINSIATGTGLSVAAGVTKTFKCVTAGAWYSN